MSDDANIAWLTMDEAEQVWDLVLNGKTVRTSCLDVNIIIDAVDRGTQTCSFDINCLCHECGHHSACTYGECSIACATMDNEYTPCHPTPTMRALDICATGFNYNDNPAQSVQIDNSHDFVLHMRLLEYSIQDSYFERHRGCEEEPDLACRWCSEEEMIA